MNSMSLSQLFAAGGIFMWPILIGLIFTVAIGLERALYMLWTYTTPGEPEEQLAESLQPASHQSMLDRLLPNREQRFARDPGVRLARTFLEQAGSSLESRLASLRSLGTLMQERMMKRVDALHTIGSLSPLFGLLGTVAGMMEAFHALAITGGQADIATLADGIWVAMITTAFGLIAAIPAQLLHGFLLSRINERLQRMNRFQDRLLQLYHDGKLS